MTKTNPIDQLKLLVLLSLINKINQNEIEEVSNIEETQVEIEETNTTSKDTTKDNTKEEQIISNINQRSPSHDKLVPNCALIGTIPPLTKLYIKNKCKVV